MGIQHDNRMSEYTRKPADRILRPRMVRPWRVLLPIVPKPRTAVSSSLIMIYGFAAMIVLGGLLLMLPVASKSGLGTSPLDAVFTAASAVCVTGLVVLDTADHWSLFGQIVIIALIQLGGFGLMTSATLFLLAFGRRIGLKEKVLITEAIGVTRLGGVVRVVGMMAVFTIIVEAAGAALLYLHYSQTTPPATSIWLSTFHSISAFNNAGFDLSGSFGSLLIYQSQPLVLLVTAALIIVGGISFLVVSDLFRARWKPRRLSLDSKLVISTTAILLVVGTALVLFTESANSATLGPLSWPDKITNAFFQSVTARTAGFSSVNVAYLANYSLVLVAILMFIGGASGSTAGGIKVNNFGMFAATIWSTIKGREHAGAFGREFSVQQINRALTIVFLSVAFISAAVLLLTLTEGGTRFIDLLFETVSAFSTVGLSVGITPGLSVPGRLIIIVTMFVGRLGPLAMALALVQQQKMARYRFPQETVRTG
jgi:trk system potassium uptake protein TrkH